MEYNVPNQKKGSQIHLWGESVGFWDQSLSRPTKLQGWWTTLSLDTLDAHNWVFEFYDNHMGEAPSGDSV